MPGYSFRIPAKADIDTRNTFTDLQEIIDKLARAVADNSARIDELNVRAVDASRTTSSSGLALDPAQLRFIDAQDLGSGKSAPGRALISDGAGDPSWAPVLDGIPVSIPAGTAGLSLAQQVMGVNGSLYVLSALSADSVRCRELRALALPDLVEAHGGTIVNPNGITATISVVVWRAPYPCKVLAVLGYRVGGTSASINARHNGADNHLSSALSLTSTDTWMDGGAVSNTTYAEGDSLEIMLTAVGGSPTQVAVQVVFART